jgi:hypothetical protein
MEWLPADGDRNEIIDDSGRVIAIVLDVKNSDRIIAAQEMFRALKNIANHDPAACDGITELDCLDAIREQARAAIAKALGETT